MSEHENIAALVVQTTQRFPNGVALEVDGGRTSYRDFVGLASVMAARLTHGTGASTATAIWADRSVASYVGVLAALMRGHCYVPLSPALPRERLRAMLLRTSCRNLIYDARRGPDVETLLRDLPLAIDRVAFEVGATAPTDLPRVAAVEKDARAYVLFTSGSTGTPKGVPVTHANVRALLDFVRDRYTISPSDRCSQTFDLTFDLSVFDMFATWTAGACLAVPSHDDLKTPDAYIRERGLTVWFSVPSLAAFMDRAGTLTAAAFPSLRLSLFCGEALPCQLARKWSIAAPKSVVENTYGPTELTVFCTFGRWTQEQTPESCELGLVPIGKPLPGMRVRVCDDELHPVEPGHVGELLMTGPQLTPGYLDDPEKTAAAYVKLPGEDAIYYRTGDRVRWKSDGEPMSFIGRRDGQIKVRGYRVELGEIENVLANYVGVSDVVVVAREEVAGEKRLIAYVVPVAGARLDVAQLRTFLGGKLPDYMVPSAFVSLDKLPLSPNGKVDRKALPAPHDRPELGTAYEAPRDETEALLAKMWSEVLRIDRVGVQDNFFGLGGDSLLAVDVLARVNGQFDLGITVAVLFENPTIRRFVTALKDPAPASSPPADQRAKPEKIDVKARYVPSEKAYFSRASFVQESMWLVANMVGGQTVLPIQIEIRGVVDKTLLEKSLNAVVARQEVLRTTLVWRDDEVAQRIHDELMVEIETINAREQSGARRQETSDRLLRAEASRLFEIDKLPLFHATLIEFSDEDHVLQFTVLQAVWDGFSTDLLCQELYAFYQAFTRRENPTLPSLTMTFAEFSEWQRKDLEGAHLQSLLRFWTSEVDGAPRLAIPGDLNGVETKHRCGWVRFSVDASLSERIDKLSAQHGITPFMWALAAYVLLLSLRSKERDILVGAVATNRFHRDTQAIMGSFINMLPLRTTITEHDTVLKFAQGLRARAMGVYQHQQLPIELLIRKLRQSKSTPQLNYILAFQPPQRTLATAEGPTFVPVMSPDIGVAGMMLSIEQTPAGLSSILQYNTVRYSQSFAEGFCSSYSECLRTITDSLHNTVAEALDRLGRDCLPGLS